MNCSLMRIIWDDLHIAGRTKIVLLALADCTKKGGRVCWPSLQTIATKCGLGVRSIQRALRELEAAGLIRTERRQTEDGKDTSSFYYLKLATNKPTGEGGVEQAEGCQSDGVWGCQSDGVRVTGCQGGGVNLTGSWREIVTRNETLEIERGGGGATPGQIDHSNFSKVNPTSGDSQPDEANESSRAIGTLAPDPKDELMARLLLPEQLRYDPTLVAQIRDILIPHPVFTSRARPAIEKLLRTLPDDLDDPESRGVKNPLGLFKYRLDQLQKQLAQPQVDYEALERQRHLEGLHRTIQNWLAGFDRQHHILTEPGQPWEEVCVARSSWKCSSDCPLEKLIYVVAYPDRSHFPANKAEAAVNGTFVRSYWGRLKEDERGVYRQVAHKICGADMDDLVMRAKEIFGQAAAAAAAAAVTTIMS